MNRITPPEHIPSSEFQSTPRVDRHGRLCASIAEILAAKNVRPGRFGRTVAHSAMEF
jgi:hypothetical protein